MSTRPNVRIERDSMGEMEVPADALYGASTMRAVLNFPISGLRFPRTFIRALGAWTSRAPARWGRAPIPWPWSTNLATFTDYKG